MANNKNTDVKKENLNEDVQDNLEETLNEETTEEVIDEKVEEITVEDELKSLREEKMRKKDEIKKLNNELDTLKDRLLRINAEYENYRKRTEKEKERIYTDSCEDILSKVLPVLDNLERAVAVDGTVDDLKTGVDMTIRQFKDALEKLQVEEIDASGEFDPNVHQAVMMVEDSNIESNHISQVFQKGYKRGEKVLRVSMVTVAK